MEKEQTEKAQRTIKQTNQEQRDLIEKETTEWLIGRPEIISKTANEFPPDRLYVLKQTGQICAISSYFEDGTVSIDCIGLREREGEIIYWHYLSDSNLHVFGIDPKDLTEWKYDKEITVYIERGENGVNHRFDIPN